MKFEITLSGVFQRLPVDDEKKAASLEDWLSSIRGAAQEVRGANLSNLYRDFGLGFLPGRSVEKLLKQTDRGDNLYLLDGLKRLYPLAQYPNPGFCLYEYIFTGEGFCLRLSPDDSQLPAFTSGIVEGSYRLVIDNFSHPGISVEYLKNWYRLIKIFWDYSSSVQLERAMMFSGGEIYYSPPAHQEIKVIASVSELSPTVQSALSYLRGNVAWDGLSSQSRDLIKEYRERYYFPPVSLELPPSLDMDTGEAQHTLIVGKGQREKIEAIVSSAERFLLVSSHIIEDRAIVELICDKALTLPGGVWILTDTRDRLIDKVESSPAETRVDRYEQTNVRKRECLNLLLEAGVSIRGGAFHLKTIISENEAYLGSCNLTRGSLDINGESGLICRHTQTHQGLYRYFLKCWQHLARHEICPTPGGLLRRDLPRAAPIAFGSETLLTPAQYKSDLKKSLIEGNQPVTIYTRGLSMDEELESLLRFRRPRIYMDVEGYKEEKTFPVYYRPKLHAKITLIGDDIAYIGGVNFQFDRDSLKLIDLMYKTTDTSEIRQIQQNLPNL